ncbi:uncharacterized protein LOC130622582 [Hydractinia symbiolongicarpus]|uniref:uncharacterized protein LOC130622582 n=1 Tax=Hydractinia symbiolongicarpus TaxID=13093 RepID=UPI00254AD174|nr:uncharacterized protein LOC130622582 [Hydractinia symbiolongicarpus]
MNRFTSDQIREYNDVFRVMDKQNRGYLSSHQLRHTLKIIGYNITDRLFEVQTILIDEDGNGQIEFDEFVGLIDNLETEKKNTEEARAAFNAFDFLGEGYIAANDIKEALTQVMDESDEKEIHAIIKHFRLEKNRKISFPEFRDMMVMPRKDE